MKRRLRLGRIGAALLASGLVFSGPCGITNLQFQEFLTSSLIRTATSTVSSVIEAAIIQSAQDPQTATP